MEARENSFTELHEETNDMICVLMLIKVFFLCINEQPKEARHSIFHSGPVIFHGR